MLRITRVRPVSYAIFAGIVLALSAIAYLATVTIAQGRELSTAQDITLDILIGLVALLSLSWLVLRQQWRSERRHERELEEEKQKIVRAISHISQGMVLFDASRRIAWFNRRYLELYDISQGVVKPGLSFLDLVRYRYECGVNLGDPYDYYNATIASLAEGKASTLVSKTNDGRIMRVVNTPLDSGGWVATHEDITEHQKLLEARERAEAVAREQKLQLNAALENMTHGLCMFDAEGRAVLFNRRYSEVMGEPPDYLQGRSLLDLFKKRKTMGAFAEDPEEFFAAVKSSMQQGRSIAREVLRGKSVLRIVDQPLQGGGWVATYEDITEQRRAERERDRSREFLDRIIDNVPSAIFVKSAIDRTYVLVNRAGEAFWGKSRLDMVGKTAEDIFPAAEAKRIEGRDDELVRSGQPMFEEREIWTSGDRVRSVFARRLAIRDEDNVPQYVLSVIDDVTERKAAEERIAHLAHYDPLTDLPNRVLFREQLEKELSLVKRGAQLAVLYLDIDHFKSINDTLGHPVGDELLKRVAHRLRGCLRDSDLISRLGGDEFAIIQTGIHDPREAEALAQRLREAVTASGYDLNSHLTTTDLSIGVALAPGDGTEIDDLVKHADLALYGAKAEGRATYRFFEPEMNARMKRRRALETDLRQAIANNELELYYQPLVNLQSGRIAGCEALLRWRSPKHGMVPPLEFIPVAEETGLINPIGEWALRTACKEAVRWPSHVSVAVNISPVQFRNPGLALTVLASLTASGLPANRLELEVTESVLMQNNEMTLTTLHQIRDLGVRISMDDFGTGYSSLSYLRRFPFDKIKIDQSFIGDLSKDDQALAVVRAILTLASSLKMATTAEGVETVEQKNLLSSLGCDQMQGHLFSAPRPAKQIEQLLNAPRRPVKVA
jgi:diguanylate cyclase (GGDEF)-like protein/PAS domain S-box-containing protein